MAKRALLAILALLLFGAAPAQAVPLQPGSVAPPFVRPDLAGKPVSLKALHGKFVLVDFWASWCPPCLIEIPHLIALKKQHAGKLEIVGVSMDDDAASAKEVAAKHPFNYPLVMGDVALGKSFGGVLGLPALFLIGPDGKVIANWRGEVPPDEIGKAVAAALAKT
jgi:thiol-disulfide isomerase/thioredoxin